MTYKHGRTLIRTQKLLTKSALTEKQNLIANLFSNADNVSEVFAERDVEVVNEEVVRHERNDLTVWRKPEKSKRPDLVLGGLANLNGEIILKASIV